MKKIVLIFLFYSNFVFCSFGVSERTELIYKNIMHLDFVAAKKLIDIEKKNQNSSNGLFYLYENYIDFLKIIISDDEKYYLEKKHLKNKRVSLIKKCNKDSEYYLYTQAEILLQWSFIYLKFEDYEKAAVAFIKAYSLLKRNETIYPDFNLNKKGLGIIYSSLAYIPNEYNWILKFFNLDNNKEIGLNYFNSILDNDQSKLYYDEVIFLISYLHINLINDSIFYQKCMDLIGEKYKYSPLLNFAAAKISVKLGNNKQCIYILENRPPHLKAFSFPHLDYLLAIAKLNDLNLTDSKKYFLRYLSNFKGKSYKKSAYQKLAWISYLNSEKKEVKANFLKVRKNGSLYLEIDRKAEKEAEKEYITHPILLKARLLYDGGYYKRALVEIDKLNYNSDLKNQLEKSEYSYRYARIISKLNYPSNEVIKKFQNAYNIGQIAGAYFSPMSALQIGLIYEHENNINNAKKYYNKCLEFSDFDFQRSIHQKARLRLKAISN
tara:strand:- start:9897 stop:11372 length:1476 start_codon:yes stop_codon:yes gene_type:complete